MKNGFEIIKAEKVTAFIYAIVGKKKWNWMIKYGIITKLFDIEEYVWNIL